MKISILGTGVVGQTLASGTDKLGHSVFIGTRNSDKTKANTEINQLTGMSFSEWYANNNNIEVVNFEDLPADTELFVNAANGKGSISALKAVGDEKLKGKTILDISNPLDFSNGFPPSFFVSNTDSLGEQIQKEFPESYVIKSLNTMNAHIMIDPSLISGQHNVFLSGNNSKAKLEVKELLNSFGWKDSDIIDLGDITSARGTEMFLALWVRLYGVFGSGNFNINIVRN